MIVKIHTDSYELSLTPSSPFLSDNIYQAFCILNHVSYHMLEVLQKTNNFFHMEFHFQPSQIVVFLFFTHPTMQKFYNIILQTPERFIDFLQIIPPICLEVNNHLHFAARHTSV